MDTENSVSALSLALEHQELQSTNHLSSNRFYSNRNATNNHTSTENFRDDNFQLKQDQFNYELAQKLFSQISQDDQHTRELGMNALESEILLWASRKNCLEQTQNSKKVLLVEDYGTDNNVLEDGIHKGNKDIISALMQKALASLSRLHICCPFPDVRNRCEQILTKLKVCKLV